MKKVSRLKTITTINGRLTKPGEDKISVFDNALLYAEGLFETFLAIDDRIIFQKEHLDRLYRGAKIVGLEIPVEKERLNRWMTRTIKEHPDRITKLRLTLTSGEAARWVGVQGKPQIILSASPHEMPTLPFKLHLSPFRIDQDSIFRRIKTLSYAIHAAALKQARKAGCDDALMLNEKGRIAEVTSANIFWAEGKKLYTPPIAAGCLEGVTRKILIREARRLGIPVREKQVTLKQLVASDELFITSSLKLVIGVKQIKDGRRVYKLKTGNYTDLFQSHFSSLVSL